MISFSGATTIGELDLTEAIRAEVEPFSFDPPSLAMVAGVEAGLSRVGEMLKWKRKISNYTVFVREERGGLVAEFQCRAKNDGIKTITIGIGII